jgi:hypothetical protein
MTSFDGMLAKHLGKPVSTYRAQAQRRAFAEHLYAALADGIASTA